MERFQYEAKTEFDLGPIDGPVTKGKRVRLSFAALLDRELDCNLSKCCCKCYDCDSERCHGNSGTLIHICVEFISATSLNVEFF
jgi:hypothetical protein